MHCAANLPPSFWQFLLIFGAIWLGATTLGSLMSGWFGLRARYPAGDDAPLLKFSIQSGWVGVAPYNNCLSLAACRGGLRVGILRLVGPFTPPFEIPWDEIEVRDENGWPFRHVNLELGHPTVGTLRINAEMWRELVAARPQ